MKEVLKMKKEFDYKKLTTGKKQYFISSLYNAFMYHRDRRSFQKFFEEHVSPYEKEEIRKNYTINILLIIRYLSSITLENEILDLLYMFNPNDFALITKNIDNIIETDKHISSLNAKMLEEMQDISLDYIRNKDSYNCCNQQEDEILF